MRTTNFSDWGRGRSPYREPPRTETHGHRPLDRDCSGRNMGPGSETGSDMIHNKETPPPCGQTNIYENITLPPNFICGR